MNKSKCSYCRSGNEPNEQGEHWIVKSIIPAKIDVRKCRDLSARCVAATSDEQGAAK